MAHYIDKDALVAEIEGKIKKYATIDVGDSGELKALYGVKCHVLINILSFINALEVKKVDLTEETDFYIENLLTGTNPIYTKSAVSHIIERTAKHFFQLGLKTAQKGE